MIAPAPRPSLRPPSPSPPAGEGKVLVLLAHPALHRSRVNRRMKEAIASLPGVTVHDLYEAYPDFDVDVAREKALLLAHHTVVFQHPIYWYSAPALLKEWMDLVLEFHWAYGPGGEALRGKLLMSAVTTGGKEEAYQAGGGNRLPVRQFLAPFEQSARTCGMVFVPPFVIHGTHRLDSDDIREQVDHYRRVIEALRDQRIDPEGVGGHHRINHDLDALLGE